jgi:hypothetical protein
MKEGILVIRQQLDLFKNIKKSAASEDELVLKTKKKVIRFDGCRQKDGEPPPTWYWRGSKLHR